jgi:hypothetical protein
MTRYLIQNKRPTVLGLVNGHRLMPGTTAQQMNTNVLTEAQFEKVKDDKTFKNWCKLGMCRVRKLEDAVSEPVEAVEESTAATPPSTPEEPTGGAGEPEEPIGDDLPDLKGMSAGDAIAFVAGVEDEMLLKRWFESEKEDRKTVLTAITERLETLEAE